MVDTVVINSQTPPEDPKHIEAMIAKADQAATPPADDGADIPTDNKTDDRPQWLPEKFQSPEDMAKAYAELEAKLSKGATNQTPTDTPPADEQTKQVSDELQSKGLNLEDYSKEFAEKGTLSPESYDALEKAGYQRNVVDSYIEGQKALAALYESEVKSVAGGDQNFNEMVEWAKANLSSDEIAAYNAAIDSRNATQAKLAVSGVYAKFSASRPSEPNLFKGTNSAASSDVYESIAQMQKDMASSEYKTDPAFRAKVQSKLARSNIL
jgi:hypothetical protein